MFTRIMTFAFFSSLMIQGCSDKDSDGTKTNAVTIKMLNIDSSTNLVDSPVTSHSPLSFIEQPYVTQRSFTPVSFKFPIKKLICSVPT